MYTHTHTRTHTHTHTHTHTLDHSDQVIYVLNDNPPKKKKFGWDRFAVCTTYLLILSLIERLASMQEIVMLCLFLSGTKLHKLTDEVLELTF